MNKEETREFGMLKQQVDDIDKTVTKIDKKLDKVIESKLDKDDFETYKNSNRSWQQWIFPTILSLIMAACTIITLVK